MKISTPITKKIILYFVVVIIIFVAVLAYNVHSLFLTNSRNEHFLNVVMARTVYLLDFHHQFADLQLKVRDTFLSPTWLEESSEYTISYTQSHIANLHYKLQITGTAYLYLVEHDLFIDAARSAEFINMMQEALNYIYRLYGSIDKMPYSWEIIILTMAIENIVVELRSLNETVADTLRDELYQQQMTRLVLNIIALGCAVSASFVGAFMLTSFFVNKERESTREIRNYMKLEQETRERAQLMLDSSPVACYLFNMNLNPIDCNHEAIALFNAADKKAGLKMFSLIFFLNNPIDMMEHINEAVQKGFHRFEWELASMPCRITFVRSTYRGELVIGAYIYDLSSIYTMLEEMKRISVIEESSKSKSRFLARMSHEIRTPITAILGISEIQLQNVGISLIVEEAFAKIKNSSQMLLGIVNDILDLSKIESGKMTVLEEEYDSASLINDILQLNIFRLGSKQIQFKIHIDENIPTRLSGDSLRLKQIMNNLLSNAFKYTESGWVNFSVNCSRIEGDTIWLNFQVKDSGLGMTRDQLALIFNEYVRFNEGDNNYVEGAGLGMSIVYSLVQLMGAKIDIESKINRGSSFTVEVPQKIVSETVLGKELCQSLQDFRLSRRAIEKSIKFKPKPLSHGKVLVVDDVYINLYVARGLLELYNLNIETCESGYEAVRLIEAGNIYDIIFMDHMMPSMDGIETAKRIRRKGYQKPIVAFTANAIIGQAETFYENGFDGFISKPIDASHLNAILNRFLGQNQEVKFLSDSKFNDTLLIEFAKSQRNVMADITKALAENDTPNARRLAHTLKGLAATIGENDLSIAAGRLEMLLANGETEGETPQLIKILDNKLSPVLDRALTEWDNSISNKEEETEEIGDIKEILENLEEFLQESKADSLDIAKKLKKMPEAAILIRQVELYDFDAAISSLAILKEILSWKSRAS